jgi:hypothetical protein
MRQGEPAFGHHLDEIPKAEFVPQIPTHAEHDDLSVEMAAFERSSMFNMPAQFHRGTICCRYPPTPRFAPEPLNPPPSPEGDGGMEIRHRRRCLKIDPAPPSALFRLT